MPPVGFEPTISAGERPQTYALDRAATGTVLVQFICNELDFKIKNNPGYLRTEHQLEYFNLSQRKQRRIKKN